MSYVIIEIYIAGKCPQVVHIAVDTEVVAVVSFLVQRYLTNTVDGIFDAVRFGKHTVVCSLHYHTAAPYTAEVGTLKGVQHTSGVCGSFAKFFPIGGTRLTVRDVVRAGKSC